MADAQNNIEIGVTVVEKSKKKWKIPRVSGGVMCYSLLEWAIRLSFSDMILGGGLAFFFFYYSSKISENTENYAGIKAMLIIFGVISCIIVFFGAILLVGLCNNKCIILLRIYCWYASILSVLILLLFLITSIWFMATTGDIGSGFIFLLVGAILTGYALYLDCIIYTIYRNIVEGNEKLNLKRGC